MVTEPRTRERQERQAHATYGGKVGKGKGGGKNPQPKWASRPERVDPWPLLEEGAGAQGSGSGSPQLRPSRWSAAERSRREAASRSRSREVQSSEPPVVVHVDLEELMTEDDTPITPPSPAQSDNHCAPGTPNISLAHSFTTLAHGTPLTAKDAENINTNMDTIQALIGAMKGKQDEYAIKCRAGLECDLQALRVAKTKMKPLDDQQTILESLVEKRATHFSATEANVQKAIADMETAKQSLMMAQKQLLDVKSQVSAAAITAAKDKEEKQAPDNMKSVQKMQDLVCLLPASMAGGFGQCLQMLEGLLKQANSAAQEARAQEVPDSDSESAASAYRRSQIGQSVPPFPVPTSPSTVDPYMDVDAAAGSGTQIPPRGRAKSAEPLRSPNARSRTHSPSQNRPFRGKCESLEEVFSRREPSSAMPP